MINEDFPEDAKKEIRSILADVPPICLKHVLVCLNNLNVITFCTIEKLREEAMKNNLEYIFDCYQLEANINCEPLFEKAEFVEVVCSVDDSLNRIKESAKDKITQKAISKGFIDNQKPSLN